MSKLLADEIKPLPNAKDKFASSEKILNVTYQKALAKYGEPTNVKFLKEARVKWLTFRGAESIAVSALARPEDIELVKISTQTNLNQERTIELAEWVNEPDVGNACSDSRYPTH